MRVVLALAVLFAVLGGGYWALDAAGRPEVRLVLPERGTAVRAVYATGVVEPESWAAVAPLESGRLVEILAEETTYVIAGDPLARLDDVEASAVIEELEARRGFLKTEVRRTRELLSRSIISEKAHQQATSELREVSAAIAGARARLDNLTLRAPVSGMVLRRDGEVGEVVDRGTPVFWVGAPRPLQIEAVVDEEDIPRVQRGQAVLVKADAFPGQALTGSVRQITPKGDPVNKSFRVHIGLPDDTPLMIGMTTETNIVIEERPNALLVPSAAVRAAAVWTVEDGRAMALPVEIGVTGQLQTEILSGLEDGRRVIADPPPGLAAGDRVSVADPQS